MFLQGGIVLGFLAVALLLGDHAKAATQSVHDEAGRVIYTIEDDGTVTMYEKSPSDKTISVSQGTREQMQPKVTKVSPESVRAGTDTVLKLEGKNLVGAKLKFSAPGIELGPYTGRPEALDIPIRVPSTVPSGEVILEVSTPIGNTKASFKIVELQIGIGGSARRDVVGKVTIVTTAPSSCPQGMVGVGAEFGGFCIEVDRTFTGDARAAEKSCAAGRKRLCQALEWQHACEQVKAGTVPVKNMTGAWEWTGSADTTADLSLEDSAEARYILLGKEDCQKKLISPRWKPDAYAGRCCK